MKKASPEIVPCTTCAATCDGPVSLHGVIESSKFLLHFELYYPKPHFRVVLSYHMSICIVRIICNWCDIPEKGLEVCSAVWEVIQWTKQQEIPVATLVISFAGHPPICWTLVPWQSTWTQWGPLAVRISYPYWKEGSITPSEQVILWTAQ